MTILDYRLAVMRVVINKRFTRPLIDKRLRNPIDRKSPGAPLKIDPTIVTVFIHSTLNVLIDLEPKLY